MPRSIAAMEAAAPSPHVRRTGIPLGRLFGFPVQLNWSVLVLAGLVTLLYGQTAGYLVGFGFVVLLLVSVLLHELGHALIARRFGIGVRGITLEIVGGYTEMERDTPSPQVELLVSLAGPAVSLALGVAAATISGVLPSGTSIRQVFFLAAAANLIVAFFNLLPGLPLDGGRALRAVVWAVSGDQARGTLVAARCGQVVGVATAVGASLLYLVERLSMFGLMFMLLVALTLWQGAAGSVRMARMARRVPLIDVDQLARPLLSVPTGTPLAEAERRVAESGTPQATVAVTDSSGQLIALVHEQAAAAVPPERRPWVTVDAVARQATQWRTVPAGLRGAEALAALQADPAGEYLVTAGATVVGVLHAADVAALLRRGEAR